MTGAPLPVPRQFLVAGLQGSGKSTFLAALWHLTTNDDGKALGLSAVKFKGDRTYVQQLETAWLKCEIVPHTIRAAENRVELVLNGPSITSPIALTLPDLSGEDFRSYFANREWPSALDAFVGAIDGVVLFINPMTMIKSKPLADLISITESIGGEQTGEVAEAAPQSEVVAWDPQETACPVVLVDLLMTIADRRSNQNKKLRVAILISAWDTMGGMALTPESWLEKDAALLDQYVRANSSLFELEVYGVSAQGGDVEDEGTKRQLLSLNNPQDRVLITGNGGTDNDLTRPLVWLLGDEGAQ
jgi:hypothetical protein